MSSGCSIGLAKIGRYKRLIKQAETRDDVRAVLGEPALTGETPKRSGGYDIYYLRGPLYSSRDDLGTALFVGMTWGVGELYSFPVMLIDRLTAPFYRQTLYFSYDSEGKIVGSTVRRSKRTIDTIYR